LNGIELYEGKVVLVNDKVTKKNSHEINFIRYFCALPLNYQIAHVSVIGEVVGNCIKLFSISIVASFRTACKLDRLTFSGLLRAETSSLYVCGNDEAGVYSAS
jgi:hypothetical protein